MAMATSGLTPAAKSLRPHLIECGYHRLQVVSKVELSKEREVPLVAFAYSPHDSRSACIAVIDEVSDPEADVMACRALGAPIVFASVHGLWQVWQQGTEKPKLMQSILPDGVPGFFDSHRERLAPEALYRAKTWGRFDKSYQLDFVDVGLMPLIEEEAGRKLAEVIERTVIETKTHLGWHEPSSHQGQWLLKSNFWLLAARILIDKKVPSFAQLRLSDVEDVFARVAHHYDARRRIAVRSGRRADALRESAAQISSLGNLGMTSTEALAYLYENALITKATRAALGTHSTPVYLVDYIMTRIAPWVSRIPVERRQVFEPACGHGAFLLGAMRLLSDLFSDQIGPERDRHLYLQQRLHGCDVDAFGLEIARLSLTLADVPNPNGWDLRIVDLFKGNHLAKRSRESDIILANPPFEDFSSDEWRSYSKGGLRHRSRAVEALWRIAANMRPGAVFGVVMPQAFLHGRNAAPLRRLLATDFEIGEICQLPDGVFAHSDSESAVIIGRRLQPGQWKRGIVTYRRVREQDLSGFRRSYSTPQDSEVAQTRFLAQDGWSFYVPSLENLWGFCRKLQGFGSIAEIGQGFTFRSRGGPGFPRGAITECAEERAGLVEGFARLRPTLQIHEQPTITWLNLDSSVIRRPGHGVTTGVPQLLLNYARVSRGPWRLKAFIDRKGHPVTSRFLVVRPRTGTWNLEALWALCNSPFANAYSYAFSTKRDVQAGLMRSMPVPDISAVDLAPLNVASGAYLQAVRHFARGSQGPLDGDVRKELKTLHWRVDAEVLRLYRLPGNLERQLLDLFSNSERRGVPYEQETYFPKHFADGIHLYDFLAIAEDWEQANDRRVELIDRKLADGLLPEEKDELEYLQRLADLRVRLVAPLPIAEIEMAYKDSLRRKGDWGSP